LFEIFSVKFVPPKNRGVPHISLVFREMWDTTTLHVLLSEVGKEVKVRGLPYLAKNERGMAHPTILGRDKELGRVSNVPSARLRVFVLVLAEDGDARTRTNTGGAGF
jgi:hypothetical protein